MSKIYYSRKKVKKECHLLELLLTALPERAARYGKNIAIRTRFATRLKVELEMKWFLILFQYLSFFSLYFSDQVHDFGACLLSYKTGGADGRECIFLSRDAKLDGSKAVRGGIPLVFPQFGHPDKSMPQHGFLRTNFWKADDTSAYDNTEGAGITYKLDLKDVKSSRGGVWGEDTEYDCCFAYIVKIDAKTITTTLEIKNKGSKSFPFQTLLHTYYFVDGNAALDGTKCHVKGLEGTIKYMYD